MPASGTHTITLPPDQADYLETLVAKGAYASVSDVLLAGLHALQERDGALEDWLHTDVAQAYDAMETGADQGISADEMGKKLRDLFESHKKTSKA